ncbi:MAG: amidase [Dehalococcoidia bacterium]|nr:amidase [Dehalococcoidia bacterium]
MPPSDLTRLSVTELSAHIRAKEVSPVEVTDAYLDRIERLDDRVNAYITVTAGRAREDARRAADEIARGEYRGPLHGIPVALKDLFATAGIRTTAGSKILEDWVPTEDSAPARRLREAGSVLLGKLNTHEFAAGFTTTNDWYGPTRNPWDLDRIPGGSSGGSGAAIAARLAAATLGTDTGGSIRVPAAFCGCVGLKPTYGRVSKAGVVPLSYQFDHPGPIVQTVRDAALVMEAIEGYDPHDANSVPVPVGDYSGIEAGLAGLRIGLPTNYFFDLVEPEVLIAVMAAVDQLRDLGAEVREVEIPHSDGLVPAWSSIVNAEVIQYHAPEFAKRPQDFGPGLASWLSLPVPGGASIAASFRQVYAFTEGLRTLLEDVDVLVTPATPIPAPRIGLERYEIDGVEHNPVSAIGRYMVPFNASRLPALVLPCGFTEAGLPISLQFAGRPFDETTLLRAGLAYEQANDWHTRRPELD